MKRYEDKAWRTMNWLRFGSEVFMVQQKWVLHKEVKNQDHKFSDYGYGYAAMQPFPTDNWRIVNLKDVVDDDDLRKVMEARSDE